MGIKWQTLFELLKTMIIVWSTNINNDNVNNNYNKNYKDNGNSESTSINWKY